MEAGVMVVGVLVGTKEAEETVAGMVAVATVAAGTAVAAMVEAVMAEEEKEAVGLGVVG